MLSKLRAVYEDFHKRATSLPPNLQTRLSTPLLLSPSQTWTNSKKRILIVGQETLGWDFDSGWYYQWDYPRLGTFQDFKGYPDAVSALIYGYQVFQFSKHQPKNYRSPFWQAYRQIRGVFEDTVDGYETSVIWSNLFRMSLDGGSVIKNANSEELDKIRNENRGLLKAEIGIIKPSAVVFFTGPNYESVLQSEFPKFQITPFEKYDPTRTALISHPDLPKFAFRTYHPNFLSFNDWSVIDKVTRELGTRLT